MNNRHGISRRFVRGLTLLELIGALAVIAIITAAAIPVATRYVEDNKGRVVADQVSKMVGPANAYINANYAAIAATATATTPYVITPTTLQTTGFLDSTMNLNNTYGQGYQIAVLQPTPGVLEGIIVSTGGVAISEREMPLIAQQIGGAGGYVSGQSSLGVGFAQGAYGGWKKALASYGVAPGTGHVAAALFYSSLSTVDDSLHRHATSGQPQYQQMSANIDMQANSLLNVADVKMKAANEGMTMFGGGEKVYGSADFGIVFRTNNTDRAKIFNDGHSEFYSYLSVPGGGNGLLIGGSAFYGDGSNIALRPAANNGTVYLQGTTGGGGVANLWLAGTISGVNNITTNTETANDYYVNNWFRVNGCGGIYWQQYGGGFDMCDSTWIRVYQDKNIVTGGTIQAGILQATDHIQLASTGNQGWGCSNGSVTGKSDGSGNVMACINGAYQQITGDSMTYYFIGQFNNSNYTGFNNTNHTMWVLAQASSYSCGTNDYGAMYTVNGAMVAIDTDYNGQFAKVKTVTFPVPAGGNYQVIVHGYICPTQNTVYEYR